MKKNIFYASALLLIAVSCSSAESDFQKAEAIGTVAAYQKFIDKHPTDTLVHEARYRKAMCDGTLLALVDYLGCDPSKHRIEWMVEALDSAMRYIDTMQTESILKIWEKSSNGQLKQHIEAELFQRDEATGWALLERLTSTSKMGSEYEQYAIQSYLALWTGVEPSHTSKARRMVKKTAPVAVKPEQVMVEDDDDYFTSYISYTETAPIKIFGIPIPIRIPTPTIRYHTRTYPDLIKKHPLYKRPDLQMPQLDSALKPRTQLDSTLSYRLRAIQEWSQKRSLDSIRLRAMLSANSREPAKEPDVSALPTDTVQNQVDSPSENSLDTNTD